MKAKLLVAVALSIGVFAAALAEPRAGDTGRTIFVERCSSCHNALGDKPLSHGLPLSERRLSLPQIRSSVNSRLSSLSPNDQRAVALYIEGIVRH
jgi:hypothetical protein